MTDQSKIDAGWDDLFGEDDGSSDQAEKKAGDPKAAAPSKAAPKIPGVPPIGSKGPGPRKDVGLPPPPSVARPPGVRPPAPSLAIPKLPRLGDSKPPATTTVSPKSTAPAKPQTEKPLDALPPPPEYTPPEWSKEVPLEVGTALEEGAPSSAADRSVTDVLAEAVVRDLQRNDKETGGAADSDVHGIPVTLALAIEANSKEAAAQAEAAATTSDEEEIEIDDDDDDDDNRSSISQVEVVPERLARPAIEVDRRPNTGPVSVVAAAAAVAGIDAPSASSSASRDAMTAPRSATGPSPVVRPSGGLSMGMLGGAVAVVAVLALGYWMWSSGDDDAEVAASSNTPAESAANDGSAPPTPTEPPPAVANASTGAIAAAVSGTADGSGSGTASTHATGSDTDTGGSDDASEGTGGSDGGTDSGDTEGGSTSDSTPVGDSTGVAEVAQPAPPVAAVTPEDTSTYDAAVARHADSGTPEDLLAVAKAACDLDEGPNARNAFRKLKGKDLRGQALAHCREQGVNLLAKVDGYSGPELTRRAQQALDRGDTKEAIRLGRASNKVERSSKPMEIATRAACQAGDAQTAAALLRHVAKKARPALITECEGEGVTL